MRWRQQRQSTNIEDRRGMGRGVALGGGGIGVLVLAAIICLLGGDPREFLQLVPNEPRSQQASQEGNRGSSPDENKQFVSAVLGSTEDVWREVLPSQMRLRYQEPLLVLFTEQVSSACGFADAAMGPFYCPGDNKLYLDFAFFQELKKEFRAPGDFAAAYVIAHEIGHHVQNLIGTMSRAGRAGRTGRAGRDNRFSIALELQADCYAGVWANHANRRGLVEAGDAEEALRAAAAVGDDMIQKRTQGFTVPDSFTHGSSRQRVEWFARGFKSGDMRACDTFRQF